MYIDIKETIWERFWVPEDMENKVTEMLKAGDDPYDVINEFVNKSDSEFLYETTEYMNVTDNLDNATVEAYDNNNKLIYKNGL